MWDEAADHPISREELGLDDLLADGIDWLDNLDDANLHFDAVKISIERPKCFQHVVQNDITPLKEKQIPWVLLPNFRSTRTRWGRHAPPRCDCWRSESCRKHERLAPLVV
jgi:hypothetical protein